MHDQTLMCISFSLQSGKKMEIDVIDRVGLGLGSFHVDSVSTNTSWELAMCASSQVAPVATEWMWVF